MKNDNVDVRSEGDIGKLMDLIKKNKIVLILIYADWCGHCGTFKEKVWTPLSGMKDRKVPLAAINEKVLGKAKIMNGVKVDGYPFVAMMGQDGRPAEFEGDAGEPTNAVPNTRDLAGMQELVRTDPTEVVNSAPMANASGPAETAPEEEDEPVSVEPTPSAEENLNNAAELAMNNLGAASATASEEGSEGLSATVSNPPDAEDDLIASQGQALNSMGQTIGTGSASGAGSASQEGGSLYYALVAAARDLAPAAGLAGAAVYLDKRTRRARSARRRRSRTARAAATAKKLRNLRV
jgi:thioredoxin-like negative regulator of GroEL